jgi:hypothetical protein
MGHEKCLKLLCSLFIFDTLYEKFSNTARIFTANGAVGKSKQTGAIFIFIFKLRLSSYFNEINGNTKKKSTPTRRRVGDRHRCLAFLATHRAEINLGS